MLLRALALQAISLGLLSLWASKEKVTRTPAGVRNARCVGGPVAKAHRQVRGRHESSFFHTTKRKALDPGLRRDDDVGEVAGTTNSLG